MPGSLALVETLSILEGVIDEPMIAWFMPMGVSAKISFLLSGQD